MAHSKTTVNAVELDTKRLFLAANALAIHPRLAAHKLSSCPTAGLAEISG